MRNCRFTDTQIIGALKTVAAGRLVKDVFRKHSILEATDIKRLNDQEEESRKLKIMVTDLS